MGAMGAMGSMGAMGAMGIGGPIGAIGAIGGGPWDAMPGIDITGAEFTGMVPKGASGILRCQNVFWCDVVDVSQKTSGTSKSLDLPLHKQFSS